MMMRVVRGTSAITRAALRAASVLVLSNATADSTKGAGQHALTEPECDVLRDWVNAGGALLFVADHAPYGAATENLARRFGVEFGKGFVYDSLRSPRGGCNRLPATRTTGLWGWVRRFVTIESRWAA